MSIYEITMLLCFGAAWPFAIYRSATSRSVEGKSVLFLFILMAGYIAGICHKYFYSYDRVIFLYMLNLTMVGADTVLYFRNRRAAETAPAD